MSECSRCKKTPVSKTQLATIVGGMYILGTSIYGTIQLAKLIISYFS
jgi:hypothetical protein